MHLRLVPSKEKQEDLTQGSYPTKESYPTKGVPTKDDHVAFKLNGNTKLYALAVILGVIPLVSYRMGVQHWGYEVATHIGFFVGLCCMLCAVGLLYFANWRDDLS